MNCYVCPACGSSVDAGEHCSCGTNRKPVLEKYADGIKADNCQNGLNTHTAIYDEFTGIEKELLYQQAIQTAAHKKHRKGIYEQICKKTESQ